MFDSTGAMNAGLVSPPGWGNDARPGVGPWVRLAAVVGALVVLGVIGLVGCTPPERGLPRRSKAKGLIAFVGASRSDPWWPIWEATARKNLPALGGFELRVAASKGAEVEEQCALLEGLRSPLLRGVCIQPVDVVRMREVLSALRSRGVVVVTMLTRLDAVEPFPHAGVDELAVGKAMADALDKAMGGEGTIAILHGGGSTRRLADRYLGLKARLAQLPALSVLRDVVCAGTPSSARREIAAYMERFPRLGGWVAVDDWALRGAAGVRFARQWSKTYRFVTYGPFPAHWGLVSEGSCAALVGPDYAEIARRALGMCAAAARGEPLDGTLYLAPPQIWTSDNLVARKERWHRAAATPQPEDSAGTP